MKYKSAGMRCSFRQETPYDITILGRVFVGAETAFGVLTDSAPEGIRTRQSGAILDKPDHVELPKKVPVLDRWITFRWGYWWGYSVKNVKNNL
jgi:hypothetical protein